MKTKEDLAADDNIECFIGESSLKYWENRSWDKRCPWLVMPSAAREGALVVTAARVERHVSTGSNSHPLPCLLQFSITDLDFLNIEDSPFDYLLRCLHSFSKLAHDSPVSNSFLAGSLIRTSRNKTLHVPIPRPKMRAPQCR